MSRCIQSWVCDKTKLTKTHVEFQAEWRPPYKKMTHVSTNLVKGAKFSSSISFLKPRKLTSKYGTAAKKSYEMKKGLVINFSAEKIKIRRGRVAGDVFSFEQKCLNWNGKGTNLHLNSPIWVFEEAVLRFPYVSLKMMMFQKLFSQFKTVDWDFCRTG